MSKINLAKVVKDLSLAAKKHSPEILIGLGIAGMLTTTIVAVKATPKAMRLIEEEKRKQNRRLLDEAEKNGHDECQQIDKLKPMEVVKVTWKCYVPAAVIGGVSTFCLIGGNSVSLRRNAALAAAYAISETTLKEYRDKVVEEIGEKKEDVIRNKIAQDRVDKHVALDTEIIDTGCGTTLCLDVLSGRFFRSDIDKLRKATNDLNRQMRDETYISLNEFYYAIGLDGIKIGDDIGWNIDRGYIDLDFRTQLANERVPCLVVDYAIEPRYEFR